MRLPFVLVTLFVVAASASAQDARTSGHYTAIGAGPTGLALAPARWGSPSVAAIAFGPDGALYASGYFETADEVRPLEDGGDLVARWNGIGWTPVGDRLVQENESPEVHGIAFGPEGSLYAVGSFYNDDVTDFARLDGAAWVSPAELEGFASMIAVGPDRALYAYGQEDNWRGDSLANRVSRWDGAAWTHVYTDVGTTIVSLAVGPDGTLYAATTAETNEEYRDVATVARWNGTALGADIYGDVVVLAVGPDGSVYAGGGRRQGGGDRETGYVVRWDGEAWAPLLTVATEGDDARILALAVGPDGALYAGGSFAAAGGVAASHVARWDGAVWHPLGSGTDGPVTALAFDAQGRLAIGGSFATAGGVASPFLTRYDTTGGPAD